MSQIINLDEVTTNIVSVTESAATRIKNVIEKKSLEKNLTGLKLRFWCKSLGGQPEYGMALDNYVNEKEDTVIPLDNGVDILLDKRSIPLLQGATIDVVKIGLNEQFKIENPNFSLGGCPGCSTGGGCSGCG